MKNITFILLFVCASMNAFSQWSKIYSNSNYSIQSIWFLNQDTGFFTTGVMGTKGLICKTTNGGYAWTTVYSGTTEGIRDICFLNKSKGFALGLTIIANMYYGIILKTIDGGNSWTTNWIGNSITPAIPILEHLFFTDSINGYITCYGNGSNQILKTSNGGDSWEVINLNAGNNNIYSYLYFLNKDTGFVVSNNTYLQKTVDGGNSWTNSTYTIGSARDVCFLNSKTGFIISGYYINKTSDGGNTWQMKYKASSEDLQSIKFINDSIGYAFGSGSSGYIYKTLNGGETWFIQDKLISNIGIYDSYFVNNCLAYAVSYGGGTVLKTTNGGLQKPKLTRSPTSNICAGDSCELFTNHLTDFFKYKWSNGSSIDTLAVYTSSNNYLQIENSSGCIVYSDTLSIIVNDTPKIEIALIGDTLYAHSNLSKLFNWYLNNNLVQSGKDSIYLIKSTGTYKALTTDSNGCKGSSDTLFINLSGILDLNKLNDAQVKLYPNPTNNLIYLNTLLPMKINIFDINGKYLKSVESKQCNSFEISEKGTYLLEIFIENKKVLKKIIVQ